MSTVVSPCQSGIGWLSSGMIHNKPTTKRNVNKSDATVAVCLADLFSAGIIEKAYDIPSNKYSLKNAEMIRGVLNVYFPNVSTRLVDNTVELLDF